MITRDELIYIITWLYMSNSLIGPWQIYGNQCQENALWFEDEIMLLLSVRVNGKDCYNFSEVNHARSY